MEFFMLLYFAVLSPLLSCTDTSYDDLWKAYKVNFMKDYNENEESDRRKIWEENARMIAQHNLEADIGLHNYQLELNKFADMNEFELDVYRKCLSQGEIPKAVNEDHFKCDNRCLSNLPNSIDWRQKNFVTRVKDQRQCGSCWAFSSTGALEGQHKARKGVLVSLSEQNLLDCSRRQGNQGCQGGWMDYAFQYIIDNQGIDTEQAYPYIGREGPCRFSRAGVGANMSKYAVLKEGDEKNLQAAVAYIGPIAVAVDATSQKFMFYKGGVFYEPQCSTSKLNHAVLVVGYGRMNNADYWIVKNSWGDRWGMGGYILMARNAGNNCGIATHGVFPII